MPRFALPSRVPVPTRVTLLLGVLSACAADVVVPTPVTDTLLFAPGAGHATFQAVVDGHTRTVAAGEVAADGTLRAVLPARPPLPAQPNTGVVLGGEGEALPGPWASRCVPVATSPTTGARLLVLEGGTFVGTSTREGTDSGDPPVGPFVVMTARFGAVALTRAYVYSDRAVSLRATLACTYTLPGGEPRPGTTEVRADFRHGWNVLTTRVEVPAGPEPVSAVVSAGPGDRLTWRFLPAP